MDSVHTYKQKALIMITVCLFVSIKYIFHQSKSIRRIRKERKIKDETFRR
jgi:hypothetical protein